MGAYRVDRFNVLCDGTACENTLRDLPAFNANEAINLSMQRYHWIKVGRKVYCSEACQKKAKG